MFLEYSGEPTSSERPPIAAGIFRGEGYVGCKLRKVRGGSYTPFLHASVQMCDKESVEIVALEWGTVVFQVPPICPKSEEESWRTTIGGNRNVRTKLLAWIAKGWLNGEKADDFFEAVAKCRRARHVFVSRERRLRAR